MQFQIVAISGRKFSGKDTAAQALIDEGYVNVKFAAPLKLMLGELLKAQGVPAEEVERYIDGDLKEVPCDFLDFTGSTPETRQEVAVAMLRAFLVYQGVSEFDAEVMLTGVRQRQSTTYLQLRSCAYALETLAALWMGKLMSAGPATPRFAMQTLGTEWGREAIGDRLWIDAALNRIDGIVMSGGKAVVSDLRFANEGDAMDEVGALKLRITRQTTDNEFSNHPSETSIAELSVHLDIANDSTVSDLHGRVKLAARNLKTVRKVESVGRHELFEFGNVAQHPKLKGIVSVISQRERHDGAVIEVEFVANVPIVNLAA